jgi:putative ABC transport system permease protein
MPAGAMLPMDVDVWTPLILERPDWRTRRGITWIRVLARLEPDVDVGAVRAHAATLSASLRAEYPDVNGTLEVGLRSLEEATVGPVRAQLRVLMAAVALMLLVAAINVGGLLLARANVRRDEMAVRAALGGGPRRLVGQLLTETAVLAVLGVLLGLALGRLGVWLLIAASPPGTPRIDQVRMGLPALLFAGLAGVLAALVFGTLPSLSARRGPADALRASRSGGSIRSGRLRDALVVSQVALALALLFGAGLLGKSFWKMTQVDLGFRPEGVLVAGLPVGSDFPSAEAHEAYYRTLLDRARALPGVQSAAMTSAAPFASFGVVFNYELLDVPEAAGVNKLSRFRIVTPDVFATLGIPFVRGRTFAADETVRGAATGAVVSEELASRWFAGRDPIGARIVGGRRHVPDRRRGRCAIRDVSRTRGIAAPARVRARHALHAPVNDARAAHGRATPRPSSNRCSGHGPRRCAGPAGHPAPQAHRLR